MPQISAMLALGFHSLGNTAPTFGHYFFHVDCRIRYNLCIFKASNTCKSWDNCKAFDDWCLMAVLVPSVPRRLRAFVTSHGGDDAMKQVRVDLRWSEPAEPGGIVSAYHVLMTTTLSGDDSSWNVTTLTDTKFSLASVPFNTVLYFKVSKNFLFFCHFGFTLLYSEFQ